jgi:hypothetical protein
MVVRVINGPTSSTIGEKMKERKIHRSSVGMVKLDTLKKE